MYNKFDQCKLLHAAGHALPSAPLTHTQQAALIYVQCALYEQLKLTLHIGCPYLGPLL